MSHIALLHIPYLSCLAVGLHSLQWGLLWLLLVLGDSQKTIILEYLPYIMFMNSNL